MMQYCTQCGKQVSAEDRFCRSCGHRLDDEKALDVKAKPNWPQDFRLTNGVKLKDDEVEKYVQRIVNLLGTSMEDCDYQFIACGDTIVWGYKIEDEILIYVTHDYYTLNGHVDQHGNYTPYTEEE